MKVDLNTYRRNVKPQVKIYRELRPELKWQEIIQLTCAGTMAPLVVIGHFYGELYGFEDVQPYIESLMKFYGYTELVGKE